MEYSFIQKYTFEDRKNEADKICTKHPDRAPIILEKLSNTSITDILKKKFLVPKDITLGQFIHILKNKNIVKLNEQQSLYIFMDNNTIPTVSTLISELYNQFKNEDGFLYLKYAGENTFGNKMINKNKIL